MNLLLKNPRSIPEIYNALKYNTELENYYSSIKKKKIIWHICSPKSASTFLMNYFLNIESQNKKLVKHVKMFRSGKNRNNIIDLNFFSKQLLPWIHE